MKKSKPLKISGKGKSKRYFLEGKRISKDFYSSIKSEGVRTQRKVAELYKIDKAAVKDSIFDILKNEKANRQEKKEARQTITEANREKKEGLNYEPYFRAADKADNFFKLVGTSSRYILKVNGKTAEYTFDEAYQLLNELIAEERLSNTNIKKTDSPPVINVFEDFSNGIFYCDFTLIQNVDDLDF